MEKQKYILWVDSTPESEAAKKLVKEEEIRCKVIPVEKAQPKDFMDNTEKPLPILQSELFRYLGLTAIEAYLKDGIRKPEDIHFLLRINTERRMKKTFPNGIPGLWPRWSRRKKCGI